MISRSRYGANGRQSTAASLGITLTQLGQGFTDMSRNSHGIAPVKGKLSTYPTRNFATLGLL